MSNKRKTEEDVSSTSDAPNLKKHVAFEEFNDNHDAAPSSSARFTEEVDDNPAGKSSNSDHDDSYFKAYSDLLVHQEMIDDYVRTSTYRRAILQNYNLFYKKVVLDVGCGTGILSLFCVQAGAKKVYAVDASPIIEQARKVVLANKLEGRIQLIHSKIEDVELPERVDVIVSEWMGYMLLYETMLPSVLIARDKWLKQTGVLFPTHARLFLAPIAESEVFDERVSFWATVKDKYKVDLAAIMPFAQKKLVETVHVHCVSVEDVQGHAAIILDIDLSEVTTADIQNVKGHFNFQCFGHNTIHGFAIWFSVTFPGGIVLSTSPFEHETHWQQTVLYTQPFAVRQDSSIIGSLTILPHNSNSRFLDLHLQYQVEDGETQENKYYMNDCLT